MWRDGRNPAKAKGGYAASWGASTRSKCVKSAPRCVMREVGRGRSAEPAEPARGVEQGERALGVAQLA